MCRFLPNTEISHPGIEQKYTKTDVYNRQSFRVVKGTILYGDRYHQPKDFSIWVTFRSAGKLAILPTWTDSSYKMFMHNSTSLKKLKTQVFIIPLKKTTYVVFVQLNSCRNGVSPPPKREETPWNRHLPSNRKPSLKKSHWIPQRPVRVWIQDFSQTRPQSNWIRPWERCGDSIFPHWKGKGGGVGNSKRPGWSRRFLGTNVMNVVYIYIY